MNVADPTIEEALGEFVAEKAPSTSQNKRNRYEAIVELLSGYLDGYAYESLNRAESDFWRTRWEEDEETKSFCRTFGPEKILSAVEPFLGWFVIRKVMAPVDRPGGRTRRLRPRGLAGAPRLRRGRRTRRSEDSRGRSVAGPAASRP